MHTVVSNDDPRIIYLTTKVDHHDKELDELKNDHKIFLENIRKDMKELVSSVHKIQLSNRGTMIAIVTGLLIQVLGMVIAYTFFKGGI